MDNRGPQNGKTVPSSTLETLPTIVVNLFENLREDYANKLVTRLWGSHSGEYNSREGVPVTLFNINGISADIRRIIPRRWSGTRTAPGFPPYTNEPG